MTANPIARLKITLDDVKPQVLRRIEAPLAIRLDRLHLALQAAIGWTNTHLYEIRAGDVGWGEQDPDYGDGPLEARKARLADVLEDVDDVPGPARALLDLAGQPQGRHRHDVEGQPDEGLGVVEPVEEHAAGGHGHLGGEVLVKVL